MPNVVGQTVNAARGALNAAGYTNLSLGPCVAEPNAPAEGQVTATDPAAGSSANKNSAIVLSIVAKACG